MTGRTRLISRASRKKSPILVVVCAAVFIVSGIGLATSPEARAQIAPGPGGGGGGGGCGGDWQYNDGAYGQIQDIWGDVTWISFGVEVTFSQGCGPVSGEVWFTISSAPWYYGISAVIPGQLYDNAMCASVWSGSTELLSAGGDSAAFTNGCGTSTAPPILSYYGQAQWTAGPIPIITAGDTVKLTQVSWYTCLCDVDVGPEHFSTSNSISLNVPANPSPP
jgi:hypothetical protein